MTTTKTARRDLHAEAKRDAKGAKDEKKNVSTNGKFTPLDLTSLPPAAVFVDVAHIVARSDFNARGFVAEDKDFEDLQSSIAKHGILEPIVLRKTKDGRLELLAGFRRFLAALKLKMKSVPCVIRPIMTEMEAYCENLIENLQRASLRPADVAFRLAHMKKMSKTSDNPKGLTYTQLGEMVHRHPSYVRNLVVCTERLIQPIAKKWREGFLPQDEANRFAAMEAEEQEKQWAAYLKGQDAQAGADGGGKKKKKKAGKDAPPKMVKRDRLELIHQYDLEKSPDIMIGGEWLELDDKTRGALRAFLRWVLGHAKRYPLRGAAGGEAKGERIDDEEEGEE